MLLCPERLRECPTQVRRQRRPSTKPSRGRAWVTHTAPKQPSLPSAEDGRAAWGPPAAAAARTMPMLRNAFQPNVTLLCTYTVRMSLTCKVRESHSSHESVSALSQTERESRRGPPARPIYTHISNLIRSESASTVCNCILFTVSVYVIDY